MGEHRLLDDLEAEKKRMETAVFHLERSNAELKQAIADEGDADREFKTAIEENIVIIARYKARLESMDAELAALRQGVQQLGGGEALPVLGTAQSNIVQQPPLNEPDSSDTMQE